MIERTQIQKNRSAGQTCNGAAAAARQTARHGTEAKTGGQRGEEQQLENEANR